jgi:hypothetical protein
MSNGFTKLHGSILTSTIWREDPVTKVVWITLLAMADQDGTVEASIPGLAAIANVSIEQTEEAMQKFDSPDRYSRSPESEGRRIAPIDGGWRLLNYDKYREKLSKEDLKERARKRQQKHRDRAAVVMQNVTTCDTSVTERDSKEKSRMSRQAEAEVEVEVEVEVENQKPLAHSSNEREGVDSVDVSPGDAPKSKNLTAAKRVPLVANLYSRYPRKVAKADAFKVIEKAIILVAKRDFSGDEDAATDWLGSRVDLYARSPQARQQDTSKVPYPATWFNGGRYDDDEAEWNYAGSTSGKSGFQCQGEAARESPSDGFEDILARPAPAWAGSTSR